MLIGILGWVILGLLAGFIGSKSVNLRGDDPRLGIVLGGAGALVGGWLYSLFSGSEVTPFNRVSLLVAGIVAIAVVVAWHSWRQTASH